MEHSVFGAELRAGPADAPVIEGYAAVWNTRSVLLYGWFQEQIAPGTFAASIANDDIRSLWNHNADYPLGRNRNNTLALTEDDHGLHMRNEPPATTWGNDAVISIRRGDVTGASFLFETLDDEWDLDANDILVRTLRKAKLYEVSPATFPAYPATDVSVRSLESQLDEKLELCLRTVPKRFRHRFGRQDRMKMRELQLALYSRI